MAPSNRSSSNILPSRMSSSTAGVWPISSLTRQAEASASGSSTMPSDRIATPPSFFDRLRQAGIAVLEFNPVNPLTINHRDHRKILISDNAVGIVGGVNLSTVYSSVPFSKPQPQPPGDDGATRWRGPDLKLIG